MWPELANREPILGIMVNKGFISSFAMDTKFRDRSVNILEAFSNFNTRDHNSGKCTEVCCRRELKHFCNLLEQFYSN